MNPKELKTKFINYFKSKRHVQLPSASLIPENDPTVLFTTAGMQSLVPYLMGQTHPEGNRLVNVQKCIRTGDIEEVGDNSHLTFFEMMGNWSLGDYFKKKSIEWSFEFLTSKDWLNLPLNKLAVTVFKGDNNAPRDEESATLWKSLGMTNISYLGKKDNWWGPVGNTGPCGPDTEIFYYVGDGTPSPESNPETDEKNWSEIWNNVFMMYNKTKEGNLEQLKQMNVDTGMGLERTVAILNDHKSVYETSRFKFIIKYIKNNCTEYDERNARIIADHVRTTVFLLGDPLGIQPSNLGQGYILRRIIRRAIRLAKKIGMDNDFILILSDQIIQHYKDEYPELDNNKQFIINNIKEERNKFIKTIDKGITYFNKMIHDNIISGHDAFVLFTSHGFPLEMTLELAKEKGIKVDVEGFNIKFKEHQTKSRTATAGTFKSGLANDSTITKRLHTATHLLHSALRKVLGDHIKQKGSNITSERLRFDFTHHSKLTKDEIDQTEKLVNNIIAKGIEIQCEQISLEDAKKQGAIALFDSKYDNKVTMYSINNFSKEVCTGPHVNNTKELGKFKITSEKSSSSGVRRIKAIIE